MDAMIECEYEDTDTMDNRSLHMLVGQVQVGGTAVLEY